MSICGYVIYLDYLEKQDICKMSPTSGGGYGRGKGGPAPRPTNPVNPFRQKRGPGKKRGMLGPPNPSQEGQSQEGTDKAINMLKDFMENNPTTEDICKHLEGNYGLTLDSNPPPGARAYSGKLYEKCFLEVFLTINERNQERYIELEGIIRANDKSPHGPGKSVSDKILNEIHNFMKGNPSIKQIGEHLKKNYPVTKDSYSPVGTSSYSGKLDKKCYLDILLTIGKDLEESYIKIKSTISPKN